MKQEQEISFWNEAKRSAYRGLMIGCMIGSVIGAYNNYQAHIANVEAAAEHRAYHLSQMPLNLAEHYLVHPEEEIPHDWR